MALMNAIPSGVTPGQRTAALAVSLGNSRAGFMTGTLTGPDLLLYQKLSGHMCWDAALLCAWAAKGIESPSINLTSPAFGIALATDSARIFGVGAMTNPLSLVPNLAALQALPVGCFIGFLRPGALSFRHCMIQTGQGMGAGNKNDCIFAAGHTVGWETLDMGSFFGADASPGTVMVHQPVTGQII